MSKRHHGTSLDSFLKEEESERDLTFSKRGRRKWAARLVDGKGVGLYLADLIARAHGASITFTSNRTGGVMDGVPLARNTFTVNVPVVG